MMHAIESSDAVVPLGGFDSPALGRIEITDTLCRDLLVPLLLELRDEPCGHSWQPLLAKAAPADCFAVFETIVAGGRPGRVFTYYRSTPAGRETLALGCVSDRVTKTFPFDGLPVVGRAFVRRAYRSNKLHPAILAHRLDYCRCRWGDELMAIHLGTAAPVVERSLRSLHAGRVVYLGDEDLGEAGSVRALLALVERFDTGLAHGVPLALRAEHAAVLAFLRDGAGTVRATALAAPLERLAEHHPGFHALHHFLRHLPALR